MEIRDNVCTYIRFKGDCSFKKMAFNEVDAMIFALLSYVDFRGILDFNIVISHYITIHSLFSEVSLENI